MHFMNCTQPDIFYMVLMLLIYQFIVTTTCKTVSILWIRNFGIHNKKLPEDDV